MAFQLKNGGFLVVQRFGGHSISEAAKMAKFTWYKTTVKGLRFRYHPTRTRKKGLKTERDIFYQFRHITDGKRVEEGIGWLFEGMTLEKAISKIHELKENKRLGNGPGSLQEKRSQKLLADREAKKKKITVAEVWEKYLAYLKAVKKTRRGWMRELALYDRYISPVIGHMPMIEVAPIHLERIKKNMADADLAPRTITYALAVTRQLFNFSIRNSFYNGANPVSKVKKPVEDNRRTRFFSQEQAESLLAKLQKTDADTYGMALLAFRCGLRASEILRLTWGDVDFQNEQLFIKDTKSGRNRYAFMTEDLKKYLEIRRPKYFLPDEPLFNRTIGPYLEIPRIFAETVNEMGFNDAITDRRARLVFHSCRHSFASWHAMAGTDLHLLQKLLGHETFSMVLRYAHLQPDTLRAAVKRLETQQARQNGTVISIARGA
jgi:integrase